MTETKRDVDSPCKVFRYTHRPRAVWTERSSPPPCGVAATARASVRRVPFVTATVQKRHRCHGLSRDATSPDYLELVRSTEIFPDAFPKVASTSDRTHYCRELDSLF